MVNFLKWTAGVLLVAAMLPGCSSVFRAPQSLEEIRAMAEAESSLFVDSYPLEVSRDISDVNDSLREGAQKCLNLSKSVSYIVRPTIPPITRTEHRTYSTSFTDQETGQGRLEVRKVIRKNNMTYFGGSDNFIIYAAMTEALPSGTRVSVWSQKMDSKKLRAAVQQWAEGGQLSCPLVLP